MFPTVTEAQRKRAAEWQPQRGGKAGPARRDHLAMLLGDRLGSRLSFAIPAGGLALWARLADGVDAECWSKTARGLGLAVTPGVALCIDTATARQAFRLGFANLDEDEITRAVELLTTAAP